MELLLRKDVTSLGRAGDIVTVAAGYGRNYLVPQGLAVAVTQENVGKIEREKERQRKAEVGQRQDVQELLERLKSASCTVSARASEDGHLFGSVGATHISEALADEGFEIDPKAIKLDEPIREVGVYTVQVQLLPDVASECKVWIINE